MNHHHAPLHAHYAHTLMEQRSKAHGPRPERRTTRKALTRRLHRMADRLDGS